MHAQTTVTTMQAAAASVVAKELLGLRASAASLHEAERELRARVAELEQGRAADIAELQQAHRIELAALRDDAEQRSRRHAAEVATLRWDAANCDVRHAIDGCRLRSCLELHTLQAAAKVAELTATADANALAHASVVDELRAAIKGAEAERSEVARAAKADQAAAASDAAAKQLGHDNALRELSGQLQSVKMELLASRKECQSTRVNMKRELAAAAKVASNEVKVVTNEVKVVTKHATESCSFAEPTREAAEQDSAKSAAEADQLRTALKQAQQRVVEAESVATRAKHDALVRADTASALAIQIDLANEAHNAAIALYEARLQSAITKPAQQPSGPSVTLAQPRASAAPAAQLRGPPASHAELDVSAAPFILTRAAPASPPASPWHCGIPAERCVSSASRHLGSYMHVPARALSCVTEHASGRVRRFLYSPCHPP
jgi:hypothetical protein